MEVARAVELHRALHLRLEVAQVGDGRRRHVGDLVRYRDQRRVLALPEDVLAVADRLRVGGARRGRRARALHACVHVRLVVVADVEHVVVPLEHAREAGEADVDVPSSPPWATTSMSERPLTLSAAAMPVATALPKSECSRWELPGRFRVRGREASRGSRSRWRRSGGLGGLHGGVERVAGAERLAAALARPVTRGQRVEAVGARLARSALGVEEAVADREGPHLVELDRLLTTSSLLQWLREATVPMSRSRFSAWGPSAAPVSSGGARARRVPSRGRGTRASCCNRSSSTSAKSPAASAS